MVTVTVNGVRRELSAPTDTPLLYVLRNDLDLSGPQFGCGMAQCGSCSVLLDGKEIRSCITPLSAAAGKELTTLEGLPARWAQQKGLAKAEAEKTLHPVQQAWIEEQTPLCGFCQNGMMIKATELLERVADSDRSRDQRGVHDLGTFGAFVPLRKLHGHHRSRTAGCHSHGEGEVSEMAIGNEKTIDVFGATLTRRDLIKTGGALLVGFGRRATRIRARPPAPRNTLDATLPGSWIEIHPDNTILIRTGKSDFGQSTTFTAYRQIVAEELNAPFEAITTVVMGDTDRTPDGSGAFDFLGRGTPNIRKAAAYTYQALLDLASQRLGVPKNELSVKDGVVSGGGKSMSYGDLVKGQQLKLTIPVIGSLTSIMGLTVTGNPPMKPVSEYTVIGKSFRNTRHHVQSHGSRDNGRPMCGLPGMLHARMVHPKTLGSTARLRRQIG